MPTMVPLPESPNAKHPSGWPSGASATVPWPTRSRMLPRKRKSVIAMLLDGGCGGALTVNVSAFDAMPSGLATVTDGVPAVAISVFGIAAVSWVALPNVVVRFAPFQRTTAPFTKFVPFTVSVNPGPPAVAVFGDSDVSVGAGAVTVNVSAFDVVPSGFNTVTGGL